MADKRHIVYCRCAYYEFVDAQLGASIAAAVEAGGGSVVDDLCLLAADGAQQLRQWADMDKLTVIACHERAVRCLFDYGRAELAAGKVEFINARSPAGLESAGKLLGVDIEAGGAEPAEKPEGWVPWFPVIDRSRCVGCRKCLEFCLFGTYGLSDEGAVEVQKPRACKTNCPACARICPAGAIIFAKHDSGPINGGSADRCQEQGQVDFDKLIGGDIHGKLRARSGKRFAKDGPVKKDIGEVRRMLGLPEDVLTGMSAEQIFEAQRRLRALDGDGKKRGGK